VVVLADTSASPSVVAPGVWPPFICSTAWCCTSRPGEGRSSYRP